MRVADTSALYAAFAEADGHHAEGRRELTSPEPILIPSEIMTETMVLLERRLGRSAALQAGAWLRGQAHVEIQPTWDDAWENLQEAAWQTHMAHPGLTHADAIVVAWCRKRKLRPLTFDARLERACRA